MLLFRFATAGHLVICDKVLFIQRTFLERLTRCMHQYAGNRVVFGCCLNFFYRRLGLSDNTAESSTPAD